MSEIYDEWLVAMKKDGRANAREIRLMAEELIELRAQRNAGWVKYKEEVRLGDSWDDIKSSLYYIAKGDRWVFKGTGDKFIMHVWREK